MIKFRRLSVIYLRPSWPRVADRVVFAILAMVGVHYLGYNSLWRFGVFVVTAIVASIAVDFAMEVLESVGFLRR